MKIFNKEARLFRIKNRKGYACVCDDHLTEGSTTGQALDRMEKALKRTCRIKK